MSHFSRLALGLSVLVGCAHRSDAARPPSYAYPDAKPAVRSPAHDNLWSSVNGQVTRLVAELYGCYPSPTAGTGVATVGLEVDERGKVAAAHAEAQGLSKDVLDCVERRSANWTFPLQPGLEYRPVQYIFGLRFQLKPGGVVGTDVSIVPTPSRP